jgi:hypothetical protein
VHDDHVARRQAMLVSTKAVVPFIATAAAGRAQG